MNIPFGITACYVVFIFTQSKATTVETGTLSADHIPDVLVSEEELFKTWPTVLPIFAPISNHITNNVCRKHSNIYVQQLKMNKLWALQMYDSSAKLPSGILRGNINQLGDFDQCLSINTDETMNIQGKYCLAFMDIEAVASESNGKDSLHEALNLSQYYGTLRSTHKAMGQILVHTTTINWGVCVPATCSYADVQQALVDTLKVYNQTSGISFDVIVRPEMCYVKTDIERTLSSPAILTLIVFGSICCIAIVATVMEKFPGSKNLSKEGTLKRIVMAFSISKNIGTLIDNSSVEDEISCLHGIRFIFMLYVYFLHKAIGFYHMPHVNKVEALQLREESWAYLLNVPWIPTDAFYILSAVLASYNLSKKMYLRKKINWINYFISRYIRLTTSLLALVLIHAYLMEYLGNGPMWNKVMKEEADVCKKSYWWNILYINNLFPFQETCAPHTYYLAMEMQLSLLLPVLTTLLWKWQMLGVTVSVILFVLSTLLRYQTTLENHLTIVIHHGLTHENAIKFGDMMYRKSQYRVSSYVLGVGLGYLLYRNGKNTNMSKFVVGTGWALSAYLGYLIFIYPIFMMQIDYQYDVQQNAIYAAYTPAFWSLVLCWLIWTCRTDNTGLISNFLSWRIFKIGSRISYGFYLIQFVVIFWNVGSIRAPNHFRLFYFIFDVHEITTLLTAAVIFTLLFDLPLQEIRKILLDEHSPSGKTSNNVLEDSNGYIKNGKDKIH